MNKHWLHRKAPEAGSARCPGQSPAPHSHARILGSLSSLQVNQHSFQNPSDGKAGTGFLSTRCTCFGLLSSSETNGARQLRPTKVRYVFGARPPEDLLCTLRPRLIPPPMSVAA